MFLFNKNVVYREKYFLYQYNDNNYRIVLHKYCREKGFEDLFPKKENPIILQTEPEEVERISLSRSKRSIREICLCNNFQYFVTLTVDSKYCDRFHLDDCQDNLRKHFKKIKRKFKDFAYIFITEKHKNGAFHFHGLIKGIPTSEFYTNQNDYLSCHLFDDLGFNSFSIIKDYYKCCNYMTKYITKDCVKNSSGTVYISSRGLKKAQKYDIKPLDIGWGFENDFCKIRDFSLSDLTTDEKLKILLTDL